MNIKTTLSITEARKQIFKIIEATQRPGNYYTLTEKGKPKAVVMSAEEFESWRETLEVMHNFPDLERDIKRVDRDVKSGVYKKYATLEEVMAKHGFILADRSKVKYEISSKNRSASDKRFRKNS
ncbi:type II toxin-antitoxin system Phd/YefM family antitoxin [Patescibacteria group bacterium]|nr:type II toxin-antitoxin system Phd/YefM family antitoxin [Patescibacteria group bacterium]